MKKFKVTMTQIVSDRRLDLEDAEDLGEHGKGGIVEEREIEAEDEDEALDIFHCIPISNLENYQIEVDEMSTECAEA